MKNIRKIISVISICLVLFSSFSFVALADEECNHSYSGTPVAPTCVEAGYTLYVCSLCGDNYKDYKNGLPARGHVYGEWYVIDEATCTEEGHMQRDCSQCASSEYKTVSVIEHVDKNNDGKCDVCSAAMDVEQIFSPFDWLVALFKAMVQWFKDIFA